MNVGKDPFAYSRLMAELWADGESFLLVEHDTEVTDRALRQALHCACWWSTSPYRGPGGQLLTRSLGFTRFRGQLLAAAPDAMTLANQIDDGGSVCPPGHWKRVDCRLLSVLTGPPHRYAPHVHAEVPHHHWYDSACACGGNHE